MSQQVGGSQDEFGEFLQIKSSQIAEKLSNQSQMQELSQIEELNEIETKMNQMQITYDQIDQKKLENQDLQTLKVSLNDYELQERAHNLMTFMSDLRDSQSICEVNSSIYWTLPINFGSQILETNDSDFKITYTKSSLEELIKYLSNDSGQKALSLRQIALDFQLFLHQTRQVETIGKLVFDQITLIQMKSVPYLIHELEKSKNSQVDKEMIKKAKFKIKKAQKLQNQGSETLNSQNEALEVHRDQLEKLISLRNEETPILTKDEQNIRGSSDELLHTQWLKNMHKVYCNRYELDSEERLLLSGATNFQEALISRSRKIQQAIQRIGARYEESEDDSEQNGYFEDNTRPVWSQDQTSSLFLGGQSSNFGEYSSDESSQMMDSQNVYRARKVGKKRRLNDMPEERVKNQRNSHIIGQQKRVKIGKKKQQRGLQKPQWQRLTSFYDKKERKNERHQSQFQTNKSQFEQIGAFRQNNQKSNYSRYLPTVLLEKRIESLNIERLYKLFSSDKFFKASLNTSMKKIEADVNSFKIEIEEDLSIDQSLVSFIDLLSKKLVNEQFQQTKLNDNFCKIDQFFNKQESELLQEKALQINTFALKFFEILKTQSWQIFNSDLDPLFVQIISLMNHLTKISDHLTHASEWLNYAIDMILIEKVLQIVDFDKDRGLTKLPLRLCFLMLSQTRKIIQNYGQIFKERIVKISELINLRLPFPNTFKIWQAQQKQVDNQISQRGEISQRSLQISLYLAIIHAQIQQILSHYFLSDYQNFQDELIDWNLIATLIQKQTPKFPPSLGSINIIVQAQNICDPSRTQILQILDSILISSQATQVQVLNKTRNTMFKMITSLPADLIDFKPFSRQLLPWLAVIEKYFELNPNNIDIIDEIAFKVSDFKKKRQDPQNQSFESVIFQVHFEEISRFDFAKINEILDKILESYSRTESLVSFMVLFFVILKNYRRLQNEIGVNKNPFDAWMDKFRIYLQKLDDLHRKNSQSIIILEMIGQGFQLLKILYTKKDIRNLPIMDTVFLELATNLRKRMINYGMSIVSQIQQDVLQIAYWSIKRIKAEIVEKQKQIRVEDEIKSPQTIEKSDENDEIINELSEADLEGFLEDSQSQNSKHNQQESQDEYNILEQRLKLEKQIENLVQKILSNTFDYLKSGQEKTILRLFFGLVGSILNLQAMQEIQQGQNQKKLIEYNKFSGQLSLYSKKLGYVSPAFAINSMSSLDFLIAHCQCAFLLKFLKGEQEIKNQRLADEILQTLIKCLLADQHLKINDCIKLYKSVQKLTFTSLDQHENEILQDFLALNVKSESDIDPLKFSLSIYKQFYVKISQRILNESLNIKMRTFDIVFRYVASIQKLHNNLAPTNLTHKKFLKQHMLALIVNFRDILPQNKCQMSQMIWSLRGSLMPTTLTQNGLIIQQDYSLLQSEEAIHVFQYLAGMNSQDNDFLLMILSYVMDHFRELIPELVLQLYPLNTNNPLLVLFNKIENAIEIQYLEQILCRLPSILNCQQHFIAALLLLIIYSRSKASLSGPIKALLKDESERLSDAVDIGRVQEIDVKANFTLSTYLILASEIDQYEVPQFVHKVAYLILKHQTELPRTLPFRVRQYHMSYQSGIFLDNCRLGFNCNEPGRIENIILERVQSILQNCSQGEIRKLVGFELQQNSKKENEIVQPESTICKTRQAWVELRQELMQTVCQDPQLSTFTLIQDLSY